MRKGKLKRGPPRRRTSPKRTVASSFLSYPAQGTRRKEECGPAGFFIFISFQNGEVLNAERESGWFAYTAFLGKWVRQLPGPFSLLFLWEREEREGENCEGKKGVRRIPSLFLC